MNATKLSVILGLALSVVCATQAQTNVLYNSLSSVADEIYGPNAVVTYGTVGDSFSTGANSFSLTDIQVLLGNGGTNGTGNTYFSLYNNVTGNLPGTTLLDSIGTVNDSQLTSANQVFDLTLSTPYDLAPDTRYWIVATSDSTSKDLWAYTSDFSGPGVADEYFELTGTSYANTGNGGPFSLSVLSIAPVPEPATLALAGLGALALLGRRRKQV